MFDDLQPPGEGAYEVGLRDDFSELRQGCLGDQCLGQHLERFPPVVAPEVGESGGFLSGRDDRGRRQVTHAACPAAVPAVR